MPVIHTYQNVEDENLVKDLILMSLNTERFGYYLVFECRRCQTHYKRL
ncbi:hypothetical protein [Psychrobacter sp. FDAARGOS_221]|nr:hypothetical protein [Psychrobacter sp. FDAARGOS_221]